MERARRLPLFITAVGVDEVPEARRNYKLSELSLDCSLPAHSKVDQVQFVGFLVANAEICWFYVSEREVNFSTAFLAVRLASEKFLHLRPYLIFVICSLYKYQRKLIATET